MLEGKVEENQKDRKDSCDNSQCLESPRKTGHPLIMSFLLAGGAAVIVVRSRTASNPPVRNDCDKHDGYRKGAVNV
jgi:hypothetical protein